MNHLGCLARFFSFVYMIGRHDEMSTEHQPFLMTPGIGITF